MPSAAPGRIEQSGKAVAVLAAAEHAFLRAGFGSVSMDQIARDAGVSKATVYAYFANKDELFGAVIERVSARRFGEFSVEALDPKAIEPSLLTLANRFLDLVLSPEAIALNRIIIAEVTRFPQLGEVFWQAGPARSRAQIEGFLRRADAVGTLRIAEPRLAAEQLIALARAEIHLRSLLRLEDPDDAAARRDAAAQAVATFLKAFGRG